MFSRLAQGVSTVLHELSGEEAPDGDQQSGFVPEVPAGVAQDPEDSGMAEDSLERLAQLEQLVVQLKELIKEKDTQLASTETLLKSERETAEARFTKLKLQAKAKMASLSKQITELKGQEGVVSPNSSFGADPAVEEELQELRRRLSEEEAASRTLQERLQTADQLLKEKDEAHAEQLRVMQTVVSEKDVRFQDQVQKHEEELLMVTAQNQNDPDFQQTLCAALRRCEELEEAMRSRSQVLEMLQQELNSADQQKQILTSQFRQMEQELGEAARKRDEERLQWTQQMSKAEAELEALRAHQEASEQERDELARMAALREVDLEALRASLETSGRESEDLARLKEMVCLREPELEALREASEQERGELARLREMASLREAEVEALQSNQEASEKEREELARLREMASLREAELVALREASEQGREEMARVKKQASLRETELEALKTSLEASGGESSELARPKEIASLRDEELEALQEASEQEREELARLREMASLREAELEALRSNQEASERQREELARLKELFALREAAFDALQANQNALERDREQVAWMERELASLREEQREGHRAEEALAELWRGVRSLAGGDVEGPEEEGLVPTNPTLFLGTLQTLEAELSRLKGELRESEERFAQVSSTMESLHEQLDKSTAEGEVAVARIQQLEQQMGTMSDEESVQPVIDPSVREPSHDAKAQIFILEKQLLERDNELTALQDLLANAQEQNSRDASETECEQNSDQSIKTTIDNLIPEPDHSLGETSESSIPDPDQSVGATSDSPIHGPDQLEDIPEEETTLVAEDSSILSMSGGHESSPELIGPQSDSNGESKGASSDEMVTSSDSEVAHSSWTLLEAVNQDGGQEWPSSLPGFGQVQLQSWEHTSTEQETSAVQDGSSSVVIRETVQAHLNQPGASPSEADSTSGQMFAQALANELQRRYSELLAETSRLREVATESQEKIQALKEEIRSLEAVKEEAESRAQNHEDKFNLALSEMEQVAQKRGSEVEKQSIEVNLLQEQLASLQAEAQSKEEKIQALQADLDEAQRSLSEQEGQARMLGAQLEDRELVSSELEQKLQDMEASLLEFTQAKDMAMVALTEKDTEISELQQHLARKDQEMMELGDGMSTKLLQAGEEKFLMNSEIKKLKEQILELENAGGSGKRVRGERTTEEDDELASLQKEKEVLTSQLTTLKKKFQIAMVQRKELMKKVESLEKKADQSKEHEGTPTEETPANISYSEKDYDQEIQKMEAMLEETKQALKTKEEAFVTLEQRISEQDHALAESHALNQKLKEESDQFQQANTAAETEGLQSQVASLELECESLQKKLQDAQEARKDTIRKAKEKDRHHREQLKQQKDDYNELLGRFEEQGGERDKLLVRLKELDELSEQREARFKKEVQSGHQTKAERLEKPVAGDWVQEDWVDFAAPEAETQEPQSAKAIPQPEKHTQHSDEMEEMIAIMLTLKEQVQTAEMASSQLGAQLQETQAHLELKERELIKLVEELESLRQKDKQIDSLSEEMEALRNKCVLAESHAEALKAELEAAAKEASLYSGPSMVTLQGEVEEFKSFLDNKNAEIMKLSQQLGEQSSLLHSMQDTVSEKDHLIVSLKEDLRAEQEKCQRLETEVPQKQEEGLGNEAKIQQLQRKLQAALISRKEALKDNKSKKEDLASCENVIAELQQKMEAVEAELEKLRNEKEKLIKEVDRTLVENQGLGASCESLKLAMEGMLMEKDACKREADFAKEEAAKMCREWEEKVQGMKDEYETLLKSYENVSDEAERVRRVLEAARQERQELAARVRTHEAARQEAERQAEAAQKEVDSVKDKMRKFAKTKQQKIMDLEEENERLREQEEKKGKRRGDKGLQVDLENLLDQIEALKADLDATKLERDSFEQQVTELREQLAQKGNNLSSDMAPNPDAVVEEAVVAQQNSAAMAEVTHEPLVEVQLPEDVEQQSESELAEAETHVDEAKIKALESAQAQLEDKIREMEVELKTEKELSHSREAELAAELASVEKRLQQSKEQEQSVREESSRREAQLKELHRGLEAEKDDLEERLMNQLAQLNGSIAGYQQEAADSRERLADLQREVERLERERAELEAQAENERDRAARLEEDKRQAQRERAEAEAETGKQRELEQKLKSAQRVKEGSQSRARQLEELLREKQLEVRQMQKDCIQYQERISELGKEVKSLQLGREELKSELERACLETFKGLEELKKTEAELLSCRAQLTEAQKQASQAIAEKTACEQTALQREAEMKTEAEQTLDSVRFRLGAELKHVELRLEDSYREREREEEATLEAREIAENAERQAHEMQARLDESLARLAAFSRCMSSLQDDRDRVLDEAKKWESRFNSTLQGKEAEVRESESRARDLAEQLQRETNQKEELKLALDRLQKAEEQWQLKQEQEEKRFRQSLASLETERGELQQALTQAESSLAEERAQLDSLESEAEGLRRRAQALEEAVGRLQGEASQSKAELREKEAEERRLGLSVEQLETDLRSSKALTETLQTELSEKEMREMELLGEKEQAVTQAAEDARREADGRAKEAEKELEERREEVRVLEDRLRKAEEESSHSRTRLDSFTKAMGSLQDDRDRVLSMYKQLEEKHLQVMMEKDGLIQEAAGENNSLKEELRALLVQRDDLNAEKAKLSAQLHGYRDDLNQVLSMKDSQHKQLLAGQLERIATLERVREELEAKVVTLERGGPSEGEALASMLEVETLSKASDSRRLGQTRDAPGAEVEKLREQLVAARTQVESLEDTLQREREAQDSKIKELNELRWEGGVMRTESETAQERVAELARDLLTLEQMLLEEKELSAQLKAQNQSFGQAMASLQDSRDQAINQAQELAFRLEEMSKAGAQLAPTSPGGTTGEIWGLKNALSALQNDRERLLEQLQKQHLELARLGGGDVVKLANDLEEERRRAGEMMARIQQQDVLMERERQELEKLQLECVDWQAQAELLKQQTLVTLSERDKQVRQLSAMLEEARMPRPKLMEEHYQRQGPGEVDSAPGAPQERGGSTENSDHKTEFRELQRRLDEEQELRMAVEEQLMTARDRLERYSQGDWKSGLEGQFSETAVLIEPPGAAISRTRSPGPGLMRMLRGALCSRQRTPLLVSLYLLTVHALLLLCLGGFL